MAKAPPGAVRRNRRSGKSVHPGSDSPPAAQAAAATAPRDGFWNSHTLEDLIREQGTGPVNNLEALSALWPAGDDPEELRAFLSAIRHPHQREVVAGD